MNYAPGKRLFKNNTGNLSDHDGFEIGIAIIREHDEKPFAISLGVEQTCWLSEVEMRLTANAPTDPDDNPFANGFISEVAEETPGAGDRFVPAAQGPIEGAPEPPVEQPPVEPEDGDKAAEEPPTIENGAPPLVETPEDPDLAHLASERAAEREAALASKEQPGPAVVAQEGSLEEVAKDSEEKAKEFTEETGAAPEAQGDAVQGERAATEEVGTPDATSQAGKKATASGSKKGK